MLSLRVPLKDSAKKFFLANLDTEISTKFRIDCFMLHTTTIFTMIDCCCTIQFLSGLLSYSPPLLHCDIYRWKLWKYIKSSMYSVKKRQHWTLYKTRYYKLWKKTQSKHKPTLHISTTFVIYLHQTIIQTNLGQTVSRSECEILP
jgi:hypothetical protein